MSLDQFHFRTYDLKTYNCLHFSAEVWQHLTGVDIMEKLASLADFSLKARSITRIQLRAFQFMEDPTDPCLVLFQNPRAVPHLGVWYEGKVIHIQQRRGVQYVPLYVAQLGFRRRRFMLPC